MNKQQNKKKGNKTGSQPATVKQSNQNKMKTANVIMKAPLAGSKLSDCTADYLRCLVNPHTGPLACVPSSPIIKSFKLRTWVYGELRTGTAGIGFVVVDPPRGVTNDARAFYASGATYAGTTINASAATGVFFGSTNSNFSLTDFGLDPNQAQFRIVGASIRIRYIGTELNRGGSTICFQDPTHNSLNGRDITSILGEVDAIKIPVKHEWISVNWRPVLVTEYGFSDTPSTPGIFGPMAIMVEAPYAGTGSAFEFQFSAVYEVNGRNVRGQTVTHIDPVGSAAAQYVTQTSPHMLPSSGTAQNKETLVLQEAISYIDRGISFVGTAAKTVERGIELGTKAYNLAAPALKMMGAV